MGTCSVSAIVFNGEIVLSQTKQFGGYPYELGVEIVKEIKNYWTEASLASAMSRVNQVDEYALYYSEGDDEETLRQKRKDLIMQPDYLSHCGLPFALQQLRENPDDVYRMDKYNITFGFYSRHCEWGYVVNLDTLKLEIYDGYNKDTPITSGWFFDKECNVYEETGCYPIRKLIELDLNDSIDDLNEQLSAVKSRFDLEWEKNNPQFVFHW